MNVGAGADRPWGDPKSTRSVVMATNGMAATSHPLAAQAGVDVLKAGGNAVDAAIAVNSVLGVVEPMSCGIGGDLFVLYWDQQTQKLHGLNASGRSPYLATRDCFQKQNLQSIPELGPLSWSTPGCVDGWGVVNERFGKLPLSALLQTAIGYAEDGFGVAEIIGGGWKDSEKLLLETENAARTFLVDGKAPAVGSRMRNPDLARTYRLIAEHGPSVFYHGEIAHHIDRYSQEVGGLLRKQDLQDHRSDWVDPVSTEYRGYEIWELPPSGQGIAALEILNLLEPFDIAGMGHNSAEFLHLFIEATKLAFADRARYYADPDVEKDLPIAELISKEYADRRRTLIDLNRAARDVPAGDPKLQHGDTVYITVVDKDRNACSFIQSIYYGWGSGHVPGPVGFMLQNRGNLFALDPQHPNRLEPHKRPFHTIIPAMATQGGKPWLCFGVMGGDMQPQGHVQVLCNIIDHGMNVQQATDAARCRHTGSATPTGKVMTDGGEVLVESGITDDAVRQLEAKGHRVRRDKGSFGGYQAIRIDHDAGILHGGSDPRKDGAAIGY